LNLFTATARGCSRKGGLPARPAVAFTSAGLQPEKTMAKLTYIEQLRHPNWQRKRLECLEKAEWMCQACGAGDQQLHVHHKLYVKGRMVWEYEYGSELEVVCDACHAERHAIEALLNRVIASAEDGKAIALGLVTGFLAAGYDLDPDLEKEARVLHAPTIDLGIIAFVIGGCDAYEVADALEVLSPPGIPRGPVFEDLLDRWARNKDAPS
jgi:hypothetical protein